MLPQKQEKPKKRQNKQRNASNQKKNITSPYKPILKKKTVINSPDFINKDVNAPRERRSL
jgi:hypothetical protein